MKAWILRIAKSSGTGVVLGGFICVGIWCWHYLDGPVAAGAALVDPNAPEVTATPTPRLLQGLYFQLEYPERFDLLSRLNTDSLALEQYNAGMSTKRQVTMAISVHPLTSGNLDEDSNWAIRKKNSAVYQTNTEKLTNETINMMTKSDNTEKSLFWVHNGKLLIVSLTTNDPNDDLPTMMAGIKSSIKWRAQ